jgi:ABC-type nitrate/sulfonate/bicarbonate transport system permease component
VTLREIVFGILAALGVGIGFAVAMHRWRSVRDAS